MHLGSIGGGDVRRVADDNVKPHTIERQMIRVTHVVAGEGHPYPIALCVTAGHCQSIFRNICGKEFCIGQHLR